FHIGPLNRQELREYVARRLSVAGRKKTDLFADDSFDAVYRFSGGIPRLINTLCDTALLCTFADEKDTVEAIDVITAAEELNWKEHESNTGVYDQLRQLEAERNQNTVSHVTRIEIRTDDEIVDVLSFPLGRVIVGRSPDNEVYIQSKFVSRHHAQLISDEDGCVIEDLNSTNGVFLGEKQVKKYRLRDGDTVSLGVHELIYHDLRRDNEFDGSETIAEESDEDQDSAVNEK
ncbi:MAG: FHA domain-containing protein, partial [Planctomycetaceae bacterium]|nr:FHA domain-containing protein [Planctomycetaceae bacterium]